MQAFGVQGFIISQAFQQGTQSGIAAETGRRAVGIGGIQFGAHIAQQHTAGIGGVIDKASVPVLFLCRTDKLGVTAHHGNAPAQQRDVAHLHHIDLADGFGNFRAAAAQDGALVAVLHGGG